MKKKKLLPSTILYKVNFKYIIDHCTDKDCWKKTWTISNYDELKILLKLYMINIEDNKIYLEVFAKNKKIEGSYNNTFAIPLDADNYNEKVFVLSLNRAVESVISYFESVLIYNTTTYKNAMYVDNDAKEQFQTQIESRLDELNIHDEEVREAYVNKKLDGFNDFKARKMVRLLMNHRLCKRYYLNYYAITDQKEKYDEFAKKYAKKADMLKINLEMKEYSEYIKNNNLLKEME